MPDKNYVVFFLGKDGSIANTYEKFGLLESKDATRMLMEWVSKPEAKTGYVYVFSTKKFLEPVVYFEAVEAGRCPKVNFKPRVEID